MKKIFLILAILLFLSGNTYSQVYQAKGLYVQHQCEIYDKTVMEKLEMEYLLLLGSLSLILIYFCRLFAFVTSYFGWKSYDKRFATTYRFNMGHEGQGWIFNKPNWLINILKKLEEKILSGRSR